MEQELLATPLLGSGEKGLTLIKSPPSFCKRQVVWVWTAGYGKGLHPQTGGQVPWCPQSLPSLAARTSAARMSRAVGQAQLPQAAPTALDAAGTPCPCLFATSSHYTVFGRLLLFIQTLDIYCRLAGAWFGGVGGAGKAEEELEACFLGFLRSDSASSPPASGTFLVPQHACWECSELYWN